MRITVDVSDIKKLADDYEKIPAAHAIGMRNAVNDVATDANRWASNDAREKAGAVGRHYHKAFTVDKAAPSLTSWEAAWGPDPAYRQGGMDFERGSGHQTTPHQSVTLSSDLYLPRAIVRVRSHLSDLFWIGG